MFENSDNATKTESEQAFGAGFISMFGNVPFALRVIGFAVVFTILVISANTMVMAVRERTSEIGVLKTLGFSDGAIFGMIVAEAAIITHGRRTGGRPARQVRPRGQAARVHPRHDHHVEHGAHRHRDRRRLGRGERLHPGLAGLAPAHRGRAAARGLKGATMAIPFVYNVRNVIQRPVSTLTTAIGIGLTVAVLLAALALAEGFRATLQSTGSPDNALVLRKGADNEVSSGIALRRGATSCARTRASPPAPTAGRSRSSRWSPPRTSQRVGQTGSSNIRVRGVDLATVGVRASAEDRRGPDVHARHGRGDRGQGHRDALRALPRRRRPQVPAARRSRWWACSTTGGSSFESEVWGDLDVLMPVFHREGGYQVAHRPHEGSRRSSPRSRRS